MRRLDMPLPQEDSFTSYVYAFGDVAVFSYSNNNHVRLLTHEGDIVWEGTLGRDDYRLIRELPSGDSLPYGPYTVTADRMFSVLAGNATPSTDGWTAVDGYGQPQSTKYLTLGPDASRYTYDNYQVQSCIVIFSYHNDTHIQIRNLDDSTIIWEGDLDSLEYHLWEVTPEDDVTAVAIESSKPVSAVTCGGGVGMYAPAFNGTFTGKDFITYLNYFHHRPTDKQGLNIIPWEDSTTVTAFNLDDLTDTICEVFCDKQGAVKGKIINEDEVDPRAIYIHSDKDISISQSPFLYEKDSSDLWNIGEYLTRGIERSGRYFGTEFYLPIIYTGGGEYLYEGSRLCVVAYNENTHIKVTQTPYEGGDELHIWSGFLDRGEYYTYLFDTFWTSPPAPCVICHVTSSNPVSVCNWTVISTPFPIDSGFVAGADFWPVWSEEKAKPIEVRPDQIGEGLPMDTFTCELEVINNTYDDDVVEIFTTTTQNGWLHEVLDSADNLLGDTDLDGMLDVGLLPSDGGLARLRVKVEIPKGEIARREDTFIVYGRSSNNAVLYDSAIVITRVLTGGELVIEPDQEGEVSQDTRDLRYMLKVINTVNNTRTGDITWLSSMNLPVEIYETDGKTELTDHNANGIPDVGELDAFTGRCTLWVEIQLPTDYDPTLGQIDSAGPPGSAFSDTDTTAVYVSSDGQSADSAVLITSVMPGLNMHNFPNPFENETRIVWSQPEDGEVTIRLADRAGRPVATIHEADCQAGIHSHLWQAETSSGDTLAPGVYVIILEYQPQDGSKRRILTKALHTGRRQ
ncbi:hypothetical protein JXM67_12615 [candidate division WOR-3 bacterium]|nr:hypothetical protein [candidate division WOR-3 bacterium]